MGSGQTVPSLFTGNGQLATGKLISFDSCPAGFYNRRGHEYSREETALESWTGAFFRRSFRRFPSDVTYYQQTGGPHEQVATAPLGGSINPWPQLTNRKGSRSLSRRS